MSVEKLPGFEEMESEGRSFSEEERIGWLALKLVPELGNRSILRLVRHFGSAHAVFQSGLKGRFPVEGIRENALTALRRKEFIREPELEWEILNKEGIRMICLNDRITRPTSPLFRIRPQSSLSGAPWNRGTWFPLPW